MRDWCESVKNEPGRAERIGAERRRSENIYKMGYNIYPTPRPTHLTLANCAGVAHKTLAGGGRKNKIKFLFAIRGRKRREAYMKYS